MRARNVAQHSLELNSGLNQHLASTIRHQKPLELSDKTIAQHLQNSFDEAIALNSPVNKVVASEVKKWKKLDRQARLAGPKSKAAIMRANF